MDWANAPSLVDQTGWIYAIYHCPVGRWYVGQTINTVLDRVKGHWYDRKRHEDLFHEALHADSTPFSLIASPLEKIPSNLYCVDNREDERKNFREVATGREKYWTGRLNSLWPYGWNSAVPGRPVSKGMRWQLPKMHKEGESKDDFLQPAAWLERWKKNPLEAITELKNQNKIVVRETLHYLQTVSVETTQVNGLSAVTQVIEILVKQRQSPPHRQFLRFHFASNDARDLNLRSVLRDASVYELHPEPEAAAAIVVSDTFSPQIQAHLFNYADAAKELDIQSATDELRDCACRACFLSLTPQDLTENGHVNTVASDKLVWPYLRTLTQKGKKFRLPLSMEKVFEEVKKALDDYISWKTKRNDDPVFLSKLQAWAEAVYNKAKQNWELATRKRNTITPEGFPGLRQAIAAAKNDLVFLHDDRAPHGMVMICKRWYQQKMAQYLANTTVFEPVDGSWQQIRDMIKAHNDKWGYETGTGIVYNYGIWKQKKKSFRYIAGTRKDTSTSSLGHTQAKRKSAVPRAPTFNMAKVFVRMLKHVIGSLKEKDQIEQQKTGLRCFWGIDSVKEFTLLVRTNGASILRYGMETYDFATMYTSFPFSTILENTMSSIREAAAFESSKSATEERLPNLSEEGWTWGSGLSIAQIKEQLTFLLNCSYSCNGGTVRRQISGMPMGLPPAPQLATLACYPVEKNFVLQHQIKGIACRYIDDFWCCGTTPPPQENYAMEYKKFRFERTKCIQPSSIRRRNILPTL